MIKKIVILPREMVRRIVNEKVQLPLKHPRTDTILFDKPWSLISICTQPTENLIGSEDLEKLSTLGCQDTLIQYFGDYSNLEYWKTVAKQYKEEIYIFNEDQARAIIEFINIAHAKPEETTLVVHCDAGVSRSGAVGVFACRYLGLDEKAFRELNRSIHPNPLIYGLLYKVSGLRGDYECFWETTWNVLKIMIASN